MKKCKHERGTYVRMVAPGQCLEKRRVLINIKKNTYGWYCPGRIFSPKVVTFSFLTAVLITFCVEPLASIGFSIGICDKSYRQTRIYLDSVVLERTSQSNVLELGWSPQSEFCVKQAAEGWSRKKIDLTIWKL